MNGLFQGIEDKSGSPCTSAFYYTPVGIDAATLAMMKEIDRVFTRYPVFGSRQIVAYLRREGTVVGRHRVRRLMP